MSVGSVLVGIAATLIVGVYLARPFRTVAASDGANLDRDIETWVAQARSQGVDMDSVKADAEPVNFCFQCGRRVQSNDRFCPGCGTQLKRED
ncbi:MAG: zinc-ribbon domain-containing protein [Chloroflexi bacterium]|nr:zinc-ribbon domain-containing protein [Chloroflexota bacterium]